MHLRNYLIGVLVALLLGAVTGPTIAYYMVEPWHGYEAPNE